MALSLELVAGFAISAVLAAGIGNRVGAASRNARVRRLEQTLRRSEHAGQQLRARAGELEARIGEVERRCEGLRRTLVEIPDAVQQLAGTRRTRGIAESALAFVEKVFQPRHAAFYRVNRGRLVAVAARGDGGVEVGHRVALGEGAVGYCARTQLYLEPGDLHLEGAGDGTPEAQPFSLCVPVVSERRTLAVILIGPCEQPLPQRLDLARTIALISAVAITSAEVLKAQSLLAATDGLTGLLNRTSAIERARALLRAKPRALAFFLFDVDHFKQYNDGNGHLAGDVLLKELSRLLRENTREDELVGRYGGEEFLIVMPGTDRERASAAAERIRALIEATAFPHREKQPLGCVSISGGVSVWPGDGDDVETLLRRADAALYAAKGAGRNGVCVHSMPELGLGSEALRVGHAVGAALLADQLEHEPGVPARGAPSASGDPGRTRDPG